MQKRSIIIDTVGCGDKLVDREITRLNKLMKEVGVVVIDTPHSIVIDTEDGIRNAKFAHLMGLDLLDGYEKITLPICASSCFINPIFFGK